MLSATFTPADVNFPEAEIAVSIDVTKATPIVEWSTPSAVSYGAALCDTQLNATASVPGTFEYFPAAGEVLAAGTQTLLAIFTPSDATNYTTAEGAVSLF